MSFCLWQQYILGRLKEKGSQIKEGLKMGTKDEKIPVPKNLPEDLL